MSVTNERAVNEKRNSLGISFTVDLSRKEGEKKREKGKESNVSFVRKKKKQKLLYIAYSLVLTQNFAFE